MENQEAIKRVKTNIINWYDFKEHSNVLAIGNDLAEMTEMLISKGLQVVLLAETELEEKFDYILMKDCLEKLEVAKKYLKPEGTILLFLNNRFGITHFAGNGNFKPICEEACNVWSKNQIESQIQKQGFSNYRFFYPLPNYEIANVIFSDEYLPEENHTKLMNMNLYHAEDTIVLDERKALKQLTKAGEFKNFANSYFIEINPQTQVKFVSFNNMRKKKYQLCTKIYQDYVTKQATNEEAKGHIAQMKEIIKDLRDHGFEMMDREENRMIVSKYMSGKSLYELILEDIQKGEIKEACELIEKWYQEIQSKFSKDKTSELNCEIIVEQDTSGLTLLKNAYVDMVFENTFLVEGQFVFFDQEWMIPNLPLEFILYRAIHNMYLYHAEIADKISEESLLEKFDLVKYLEIFQASEKMIQELIVDKDVAEIYGRSQGAIKDVNQLDRQVQLLTKEKGELEYRVGLLAAEEKKKGAYIDKLTQESAAKSDLINEMQRIKTEQESQIQNLEKVDCQKDEIIKNLNEIIKVKEHEIEIFENMKAVKIAKKLREFKNHSKNK